MARLINNLKKSWLNALMTDAGDYRFERGLVIRARKP